MNKNILKKCLDELNKESPNIEKVKGMLETMIEIDAPIQQQSGFPGMPNQVYNAAPGIIPDMNQFPVVPGYTATNAADETTELAASYARGPITQVS
jgi:N-dimethylarginine dimethylaminohydrolase